MSQQQLAGDLLPNLQAHTAEVTAAGAAADGSSSAAAQLAAQQRQILQQLAGDLLSGTAALLLPNTQRVKPTQPVQLGQRMQQDGCVAARMWRNCLQYNLQRCRDGAVGVEGVAVHVQQRAQQVLARLVNAADARATRPAASHAAATSLA
jgi:hypothetical protein